MNTMDPVQKRTETTFRLSEPTPKRLYRIRVTTEVTGEKIESTVNELFTEDQAKALLMKLQKGK